MMSTRQIWHRTAEMFLLLGFALSSMARAQDTSQLPIATTNSPSQTLVNAPVEADSKPLTNYVESGGNYLTLTNGFGYWAGGYFRGVLEKGNSVWNAEVNGQEEFNDAGVYVGVGNTYNFNPDWYGSLTVGSSVGGFFWPRFRTDGFINKKWLGRKQWITTFGVGYYSAKDVHRDTSFFLGSTYYFDKPWVVEEGVYFNLSDPGKVFAPAGFVAVTQGREKHYYVTVRAGAGEEAYQIIGPTTTLTDFQSQALTITVRKWMGHDWGFNFVADYYHNPYYTRGGSTLGLFKDF
jgi:YaiO family outer membrane protein